ncbi:MAG: hypothetical protein WCX74_00775 [Candidatus Paceibacterota bacterium]
MKLYKKLYKKVYLARQVLRVTIVFAFVLSIPVYAKSMMYDPGETLTPACAPTDVGCGVKTPIYIKNPLTDGELLFALSSDWVSLPVGTNGQILRLSGGVPTWDDESEKAEYSAGSGLLLTNSTFALDFSNANTWSGIQFFNNGFKLGSNTYNNLTGEGLVFSNGTLSSTLGTNINTSEIENGAITTAKIANGAITFGNIAQNSCANNEIIKWNGSNWACDTDNNNIYTAGTGLSLSSNEFSLNISGLTMESTIDNSDTIPIYNSSTKTTKQISRTDFLSGITGALVRQGAWDASANSPSLTDGNGSQGKYYVVSNAGSQNLGSGIINFTVGDWVVHNGTRWEKINTSNAVDSVFGRIGTITANAHDYNAAQIDNIPNGNISATNVQDVISELDSEKLGTALNNGLVFIGNVSNIATGVTLSGDATISNSGVLTINSNAVTLGNDTNGNYVAGATSNGGLALTGTEGATLGIQLDGSTLVLSSGGLKINLSNANTWTGAQTFGSAIAAPTSSNTINGLVINSGSLSGITDYNQSSGNFAISGTGAFVTGSGAISLNGNTNIANGKTLSLADMTQGSIIFAGSSGVVSQSNNKLYWDNTSNRLGIGTSSPDAALTLAANSTIDSLGELAINSNTSNALILDSGTTGAINIGTNANAKTITLGNTTSGTLLAINAGDATTGSINLDSNTLYIDTVNNRVGIGMNNPSALMHITTTATSSDQDIFKITGPNNTTDLTVNHVGQNFGGIISSGAFINNTSVMSEEFNNPRNTTAATADQAGTIGDYQGWTFDTSSTTATYSTPLSSTGGIMKLSFGTTSTVGSVVGMGRTVANYNAIYLKANLPVLQVKMKPSSTNDTEDYRIGFFTSTTAVATASDASPTNGIYFSNENGTSWVGVVRSSGANVGTVTCPGSISTSQFAVGRIIVESSTAVRFFIDTDASNGVEFQNCGTVTGANPSTALAVGMMYIHNSKTAATFEVDYFRTWQDDSFEDQGIEINSISTENASNALDTNSVKQQFQINDSLISFTDFIANIVIEKPIEALDYFKQTVIKGKDYTTEFVAAKIIAVRGYFDEIFTNRSHQKEVCIGTLENETCIRKEELDNILKNLNASPQPSTTPNNPEPDSDTSPDNPTNIPIIEDVSATENIPIIEDISATEDIPATDTPIENQNNLPQ